jgi:hypothetical protein
MYSLAIETKFSGKYLISLNETFALTNFCREESVYKSIIFSNSSSALNSGFSSIGSKFGYFSKNLLGKVILISIFQPKLISTAYEKNNTKKIIQTVQN